MMNIEELLAANIDAVRQHWLKSIIDTYPPDSREFFASKKDRFQNPVGDALSQLVDSSLQALLKNESEQDFSEILTEFVKMRAVQEFSPSAAVGFILFLKDSVREILSNDLKSNNLTRELAEFGKRVDNILLTAFDIYTKAKEKMYEIRLDEMRRRSFTAFRMIDSNSE